MARFFIGSLLSLFAFCLAFFMEGGDMLDFVLPSPLIIVILVPLFAVFAVWSGKELGGAWSAAFGRGRARTGAGTGAESGPKDAAALWDFFEKAFYAAGIVGTLAGFIIIFASDEIRMRALSIALMPLVEGILLGLIARILGARVEKNARVA
jgi:flagellar motor component MotA